MPRATPRVLLITTRYALAVSFGAIMDNPDLIVTCIVGDGEAETGPTAA
jgi:xylulose-5-phosphate/fructose-6-phosphate phosphoketolase